MTAELIASELNEKELTVRRILNRYKNAFVVIDGGAGVNRYGLARND
jgi:hypothetical protein